MRKVLTLAILAFCLKGQAQLVSRGFRMDLGLGAAKMFTQGTGPLLSAEPAWSFGRIRPGLRFEATSNSMKMSSSVLVTGNYYPASVTGFRPFLGAGIGAFGSSETPGGGCSPGPSVIGGVTTTTHTGTLGSMLRAGFELSHFRFSAEYNFAPAVHVYSVDASGKELSSAQYPTSYLSLKAGFVIGRMRARP